MDETIRQQWVDALRSGRYTQGAAHLQINDEFCCLGVLCDLAVKAGVIPEPDYRVRDLGWGDGQQTIARFDEQEDILPVSVMRWAGLDESNPVVTYDDGYEGETGTMVELAELNDNGETFDHIADLIVSSGL